MRNFFESLYLFFAYKQIVFISQTFTTRFTDVGLLSKTKCNFKTRKMEHSLSKHENAQLFIKTAKNFFYTQWIVLMWFSIQMRVFLYSIDTKLGLRINNVHRWTSVGRFSQEIGRAGLMKWFIAKLSLNQTNFVNWF